MSEGTRWWGFAALVLLTPLAFYPGLLTGALPQLHPWESSYAELLRTETVSQVWAGQVPLWSSTQLAGVPLLEDPRSALGSPQAWLTGCLGPSAARGLCAWLFTAVMGVGTLAWARGRQIGPGVALLAAVLAQANPALHLGLIRGSAATLCWLPWVLFALDRRRERGGMGLSLAVALLLCGGDPALALCALLGVLAVWVRGGAKLPALWALLSGVLLSAPLTLPALGAWADRDGGWGDPVWQSASALDLGWPLLAVGLWGLAAAATRLGTRLPQRGQSFAAAAALLGGVVLCGPLRPQGEPMDEGPPAQARSLGLESVPLSAGELRGAPLWPSVQARRFAEMLDPNAARPGLWVESVHAQNRAVLEFAGATRVRSATPLFGLAPVDLDSSPKRYALDGGPRAWLTPGGRPAANEREALDFLRTRYAFWQAPAIQELDRRLPTEGEVTPLEVQDHGRVVRIALPPGAAGVLVLADRWEPEWAVQVDGQDAPLLQVGGLFRGVLLPVGAREVVFDYTPWTWAWGLGFGALGALGALGLALRKKAP